MIFVKFLAGWGGAVMVMFAFFFSFDAWHNEKGQSIVIAMFLIGMLLNWISNGFNFVLTLIQLSIAAFLFYGTIYLYHNW